jgi:hypothetical protein
VALSWQLGMASGRSGNPSLPDASSEYNIGAMESFATCAIADWNAGMSDMLQVRRWSC